MGCVKLKGSLMNVDKIERMFDHHDNDWLYMITASCCCESGGVLTWIEYDKPEYSIGEEVSVTLKWHDEEAKQRIKKCKGDIPMPMFKLFNNMLEELCDEYSMDDIMDALEELAEEYEDENKANDNKDSFECDDDCDNCIYNCIYVDDSDEYEYSNDYREFEADIADGVRKAVEDANFQNKLWDDYKKAQSKLNEALDEYNNDVDEVMFGCDEDDEYDSVSHPFHYASHGIETIDKIEAVIDGLPAKQAALLANIIKYVDRAGLKDDAKKDLDKANAYAHRLVYGHWRKQ